MAEETKAVETEVTETEATETEAKKAPKKKKDGLKQIKKQHRYKGNTSVHVGVYGNEEGTKFEVRAWKKIGKEKGDVAVKNFRTEDTAMSGYDEIRQEVFDKFLGTSEKRAEREAEKAAKKEAAKAKKAAEKAEAKPEAEPTTEDAPKPKTRKRVRPAKAE